jgi:hypothetical protein
LIADSLRRCLVLAAVNPPFSLRLLPGAGLPSCAGKIVEKGQEIKQLLRQSNGKYELRRLTGRLA